MIELTDVRVGVALELYFVKNNINNKTIFVRGIVDEEQIVVCVLSPTKDRYIYSVEHISWFDLQLKHLTIVDKEPL